MRNIKDPELRKKEIIETARQLFEKNGIKHTRVNDIVKSIGVAQGLFYYYFESKEDVVSAVIEQYSIDLYEKIQVLLASVELNFCQKIVCLINFYIDAGSKLVHDDKDTRELLGYKVVKKLDNQIACQLNELVNQGIRDGILKIKYPNETLSVIFYGIRELQKNSDNILSDKLFFTTLLEQCLQLPAGALKQ